MNSTLLFFIILLLLCIMGELGAVIVGLDDLQNTLRLMDVAAYE